MMSNIPAEAVEAAAKKLALKTYFKKFETLDDYTRDFLRDSARLALKAAAPSIMAAAWDAAAVECAAAGWLHDYGADDLRARNPYRTPDAR